MSAPGEPLLLRLLLLPISFSVLPTSERSIVLDCITHGRDRYSGYGHVRGSRTRSASGECSSARRDRSRVTDTHRRQTLATSASRGERPRVVVIVSLESLTGARVGRGRIERSTRRHVTRIRFEEAAARKRSDGVRNCVPVGANIPRTCRDFETVYKERKEKTMYMGERNEGRRTRRKPAELSYRRLSMSLHDLRPLRGSTREVMSALYRSFARGGTGTSPRRARASGRTRARSLSSLHQLHGVGGRRFRG